MVEDNKTTHFGFEKVKVEDKAAKVKGVFDSVADNYDLMNDVMSLGIHRLWKRFTVEMTGLEAGQKVLDLAGGTGDLARMMAPIVGKEGKVVLSDINQKMLDRARARLVDSGVVGNIDYVKADAEDLPFPDSYFDCVTMAFGLRNVTDKQKALRSIYRVLKTGGKILVLEFSKPTIKSIEKVYDFYSFNILPLMGQIFAKDSKSYKYLAESIRQHPPQEELKTMLQQAGFLEVDYFNLTAGIVALHRGYKIEPG